MTPDMASTACVIRRTNKLMVLVIYSYLQKMYLYYISILSLFEIQLFVLNVYIYFQILRSTRTETQAKSYLVQKALHTN